MTGGQDFLLSAATKPRQEYRGFRSGVLSIPDTSEPEGYTHELHDYPDFNG